MNNILFSSWGGLIIDNRGKEPQTYESVDHVTLPEYFDDKAKIKAVMGWDGIIIRSADVDILDLYNYILYIISILPDRTCNSTILAKTGTGK